MLTTTENSEQAPVNLGKIEIRCPMGFTIQEVPASAHPHSCGHASCYPAACEILKRMWLQTQQDRLQEDEHVHVD